MKFNKNIHPSYKTQFDKLTKAYINGEVRRLDSCACFVGNLLNGNGQWGYGRKALGAFGRITSDDSMRILAESCILKEASSLYTLQEILDMEALFMGVSTGLFENYEEQENALFAAFEQTLEMLKQIHIAHGEQIEDEIPVFIKRELQTA